MSCPWGHHRCYKYRQVNLLLDRDHMVAFLYAWALMGQALTREQHRDEAVPSDDAVQGIVATLFGHR